VVVGGEVPMSNEEVVITNNVDLAIEGQLFLSCAQKIGFEQSKLFFTIFT
jgi:hypothetical protein